MSRRVVCLFGDGGLRREGAGLSSEGCLDVPAEGLKQAFDVEAGKTSCELVRGVAFVMCRCTEDSDEHARPWRLQTIQVKLES